jgi:hypothetical protein
LTRNRLPTQSGDQNAAQRRPECRADRGHRAEQPHRAAGFRLRNRFADQRHGERHHDGRAQALHRPRGDQQPERGREAAQDGGAGEQQEPGQQQTSAADDIAQPSDADDQGRDGKQIGENDPLDVLERGVERLRQRRQGHVGDAGAERGQQDGKRQAGKCPPIGAASGGRRIACGGGWFQDELRCRD